MQSSKPTSACFAVGIWNIGEISTDSDCNSVPATASTLLYSALLTVGGRAPGEVRVVALRQPLDQIHLLQGELHRVPELGLAGHVRGPELQHKHTNT